jgi:hypothetical protein
MRMSIEQITNLFLFLNRYDATDKKRTSYIDASF